MINQNKIAVFVSFSGQGGVERMIFNLCEGMANHGFRVDLLLVKANSEHLGTLPSNVNVVNLGASHTLGSLPALVRYLRKERPLALLAAKDRANQVAVVARLMARSSNRLVLRMGTTVSAALEGKSRLKAWLWYFPMRLLYPLADEIVAVSSGVAEDLADITGFPATRLRVIANPVIFSRLSVLAAEHVELPWLMSDQIPVILGAGRLTRQKDFPTLVKAFARVRAMRPCRLIILGEGKDRKKLEHLIDELGIASDVWLSGFVDNPYAYIARASLFVLSSAWEGSPNVLTEALALGIPVVATRCPSGPAEILENGRYGRLVEVGDADGMADAMLATLVHPPKKSFLKQAVRSYTVEMSSRCYLETLLGTELRINTE